jgi:hypothetical protein
MGIVQTGNSAIGWLIEPWEQVLEWLRSLGYDRFCAQFKEQEITGKVKEHTIQNVSNWMKSLI